MSENAENQPVSEIEIYSAAGLESNKEAMKVIKKLFAVAQPEAIFGQPITQGEYTVITAAEMSVGLGFGSGGGDGTDGGGSGGGGASVGRPVAAISIGPKGVDVEPIVDPTKIAIAMFTTIGAIFMTWRAMRRQSRG